MAVRKALRRLDRAGDESWFALAGFLSAVPLLWPRLWPRSIEQVGVPAAWLWGLLLLLAATTTITGVLRDDLLVRARGAQLFGYCCVLYGGAVFIENTAAGYGASVLILTFGLRSLRRASFLRRRNYALVKLEGDWPPVHPGTG